MIARIVEWLIVVVCALPIFYALYRLTSARRIGERNFDGVRMGSPKDGATYEIVDPPWWNIPRMFLRRRAVAEFDFMASDPMTGNPKLFRLKGIRVDNPSDRCPTCKRPFRLLP